MDNNWQLYVKISLIAILIYFLVKAILRIMQLSQFRRTLNSATPVSSNSKKGDYIHFSGTITLPSTKTPLGLVPCMYWGIIVRAVFETRKKKPGKGLQTHMPIIYKAESDQLPFLISIKNQLLHLVIDNPMRFMVNIHSKNLKSKTMPIKEVQSLIKYKSYDIDEYWLPENAVLHIWAFISDINNNCISISSGDNPKIPTLIYCGDKKSIFKKFNLRIITLYLLILWSFIGIYLLTIFINNNFSNTLSIALEIFILIIGYALYRYGKIHFVRK